ncbi:MAG: 4-(cytidine 5'-diphospho)-2-C-methyl-D-erythritol kinase [Treponema sp.]|jgi:4-diphosphocytidyl-2-C-methyl-D-erythritol kinase|nr:4-(cytidine 5'-diphospho)-2-C-methyl-D-erythritol kinase [Treponema sp.]
MPELTIQAPGKINLHLRVKGTRPDGYHDLESVFLALNFGDTLRVRLLDEPETTDIRVSGTGFSPPEENIIYKAVSLFRAETGFNRGLRVDVEKRIPLGGGMGGGSSDAASALLALNDLAGTGLSAARLGKMAGTLGSDVPFFLTGGAAWVSGRGENIQPLPDFPDFPVALVNPGFSSGTAGAFRLLDASRLSGASLGPVEGPAPEVYMKALGENPRNWPFWNDFLPALDPETGGVYSRILSRLKGLGADFSGLSGAGSTCFGVFGDGEKAEKAVKILEMEWPFVQLTAILLLENFR